MQYKNADDAAGTFHGAGRRSIEKNRLHNDCYAGEAHEHHVAVVVGLRGVALPVVDTVEHIERLDNLGEGGVVVGQAEVVLEGLGYVAHTVVEDIGGVEEGDGGERVDRVERVGRGGEVLEIVGDTVGVVGVAQPIARLLALLLV